MQFDRDGMEEARRVNPEFTVFDTGEMLEPHYVKKPAEPRRSFMHRDFLVKSGSVEYADNGGTTILTACAYPSAEDDDTVIIQIDSDLVSRLKIVVNDGDVVAIDTEGNATFLISKECVTSGYAIDGESA